jgi:hypothetical protein
MIETLYDIVKTLFEQDSELLLTCSVMPLFLHFSQVGVAWSQRILDTRHGSQDLKRYKLWFKLRTVTWWHKPRLAVSSEHFVALHSVQIGFVGERVQRMSWGVSVRSE